MNSAMQLHSTTVFRLLSTFYDIFTGLLGHGKQKQDMRLKNIAGSFKLFS